MSSAEYRLRFTADYLLEATARYRKTVWWRTQYNALRWIVAAALALLVGVAFWAQAYTAAIALGGFLGALLGVMLLGDPIDAWIASRRLRKSPFHNNDLVFRITADDLHVTGTNEDSHLKWSAFSKARRFSDGLLLFQGPHFFNWLPDTAAVDSASIVRAQELARSQVKDYCDV